MSPALALVPKRPVVAAILLRAGCIRKVKTVYGPEEKPVTGQGPEPGMQDGGDEEGRVCSE